MLQGARHRAAKPVAAVSLCCRCRMATIVAPPLWSVSKKRKSPSSECVRPLEKTYSQFFSPPEVRSYLQCVISRAGQEELEGRDRGPLLWSVAAGPVDENNVRVSRCFPGSRQPPLTPGITPDVRELHVVGADELIGLSVGQR